MWVAVFNILVLYSLLTGNMYSFKHISKGWFIPLLFFDFISNFANYTKKPMLIDLEQVFKDVSFFHKKNMQKSK